MKFHLETNRHSNKFGHQEFFRFPYQADCLECHGETKLQELVGNRAQFLVFWVRVCDFRAAKLAGDGERARALLLLRNLRH